MARPKRPDPENRIRLHFINEWAERRNMSQKDIAELLDVDPGTVSRWFAGALPAEMHLPRIAAMLEIDLCDLFREPYNNWLARFFERRNQEEKQRIRTVLKAMFPDEVA